MGRPESTRRPVRRSDARRGGAFRLIVRGPDGLLRFEHFADAAGYRARLRTLDATEDAAISIEELARWLETFG